jgi:hypothetical protein
MTTKLHISPRGGKKVAAGGPVAVFYAYLGPTHDLKLLQSPRQLRKALFQLPGPPAPYRWRESLEFAGTAELGSQK